jgi:MinD-like ATPase involved in chromosome partitioning or flagellar assembly
MTKVIAIHSTRGGVGKTRLAVNLALAYARQGHNVALIDLDFRAPSLSKIIPVPPPTHWMNDFLDGHVPIGDVLVDVTPTYHTDGRLLVGLIDASLDAIRTMASKDKRWEMHALRRLMAMKSELAEQGMDYVIFDTSPGVLYSSVNAVACADLVVVVTTADTLALKETQWVITELYTAFDKPTYVLLNKVLPAFQYNETQKKTLLEQFTPLFTAPILSIVPCYCDLLNSRTTIHTLEQPDHPFSQAVYDIAHTLATHKP